MGPEGNFGGEYKPLRTGQTSVILYASCDDNKTCLKFANLVDVSYMKYKGEVLSGVPIRNCLFLGKESCLRLDLFFKI